MLSTFKKGVVDKDALKSKIRNLSGHSSEKRGRSIFVVHHEEVVRKQLIDAYDKICEMCTTATSGAERRWRY